MKSITTLKQLGRFFWYAKREAPLIMKDKKRAGKLLQDVTEKARANNVSVQSVWQDMQSMIMLVRAYFNGSYTHVPKRTIISIIAALVYFALPTDAIPDVLLGFGYIDDVFVLGMVYKQVAKQIDVFKQWQLTNTPVPAVKN